MAIPTYGVMGVDWEDRVNFERLRTERLARIKNILQTSEAGAFLCFDMNNVRYICSSTHIGSWAQDKISTYTLLARDDEPIIWDLGSAAKHHQLHCHWLNGSTPTNARDHRPRSCAARFRPRRAGQKRSPRRSGQNLRLAVFTVEPVAIDIVELPILFALQQQGLKIIDGQQLMLEARKIKTKDEITLLATAAGMVDSAYDALYPALQPGFRECEAVGLVSKLLYEMGSEYVEGVNAIAGERCSPHPHVFSDRPLSPDLPRRKRGQLSWHEPRAELLAHK